MVQLAYKMTHITTKSIIVMIEEAYVSFETAKFLKGETFMTKAEKATNDFCTRCFKYDKCTKVQSECALADSYEEGYEDGYHQAEEDLKLTWEDMRELHIIFAKIDVDIELCKTNIKTETLAYYQEVLKRFKNLKERKEK